MAAAPVFTLLPLFVCGLTSLTGAACDGGGETDAGSADAGTHADAGGDGGGADGSTDPDGSMVDRDGGTPPSGPRSVFLVSEQPPDEFDGSVTMVRLLSLPADEPDADFSDGDPLFDGFVVYSYDERLNPQISPDGTMVAFLEDPTNQLYVAPVDGSRAAVKVNILDHMWVARFAWSPDSSRLFLDQTGNFQIVSPDAAEQTFLDPPSEYIGLAGDVTWANDSSRVIFRTYDGDGGSYAVVATPGEDAMVVLTPGGGAGGYGISADGSRVAYDQGGNVYVADADGTDVTTVSSGESLQSSPSGDRLVYVDGTDLESVGFDGASVVTVHAGTEFNTGVLSWAPDGSRFLYGEDTATDGFRLAAPDGSLDVAVGPEHPRGENRLAWSPDSLRLAFTIDSRLHVAIAATGATAPHAPDVSVMQLAWTGTEAVSYWGTAPEGDVVDLTLLGPVTTDLGDRSVNLRALFNANRPGGYRVRRINESNSGFTKWVILQRCTDLAADPECRYTSGPERVLAFSRYSGEWEFTADRELGFWAYLPSNDSTL